MVEQKAERGRANLRFAGGTLAGVLAGSLVVLGALNLVPPRTAVPVQASPSAVAAPSSAPTDTGVPAPVQPPGSPNPSFPVETPATPSESPTPSDSATPLPAGEVVTSLPRTSYVAVFQWLPKSKYSAEQAAARAAENQRGSRQVVAIEGGLIDKPGNYGLGVVNLPDFAAASAACVDMGLSTSGKDCYRRMVIR